MCPSPKERLAGPGPLPSLVAGQQVARLRLGQQRARLGGARSLGSLPVLDGAPNLLGTRGGGGTGSGTRVGQLYYWASGGFGGTSGEQCEYQVEDECLHVGFGGPLPDGR